MKSTPMSEQEVIAHYARLGRPLPRHLRVGGVLAGKGVSVASEKVRSVQEPERADSEPRGRMNGLETKYTLEVLGPRKLAGEVLDYWYESIRFRMAKNVNFTIDFIIQTPSGWEAHEVKGYKHRANWSNFKTVSEMKPFSLMFKFYLCRKIKGEWIIERFGG